MTVRLSAERLEPIVATVLRDLGVDAAAAGHVASSLVSTSLRGVDSHGIHLLPHYCRAVKAGRIDGTARPRFEATAASTGVLHAEHAFGHHAGAVAMDRAIDLAEASGVGAVAVRDSTHFGAAAFFALRASARGHIGLAFTNADALVKAWSARAAFFGTNPVCFTAPMAREEPFCLDMATSLVSWNKVLDHRGRKEPLPTGWAYDAHGDATTDADAARALAPAGNYKGFGLGMMVEILCGALAAGPVAHELLPMYTSPIEARRRISHFFVAIDVARFTDRERFRATIQGMADAIRALPALDGPPMVAGDPEKRCAERRRAEGIPVHPDRWAQLLAADASLAGAQLP